MLLITGLALATTNAASFSTDSGDWTGGSVADGVLSVTDGSATLVTGALASFTLDARLRLSDGDSITTRAGDAELVTSWGPGGEVTLGTESTALSAAEQEWNAISTGLDGSEPELVRMNGSWLLYRAVEDLIEAATSADGVTWTDVGVVADGTAPDAVIDGDRVVLYTNCGTAICRVDSGDGLEFGSPVAILDGELSAVSRDDDGMWWIWYTATGELQLASSTDGVTFSLHSTLADDGRLHALDVLGSYDGAWDAYDGLHLSHDVDPAFADTTDDVGPLTFGCEAPTDPSLAMDGNVWYLAAVCDGTPSVAAGTPAAGSWANLHMEWDGATLTATWGEGEALTTTLTAVDSFSFEALGTLELDEVVIVYAVAGDDTGDTGDTADTADTSDTATPDGDSGDTASGPLYSAADLTGEPGGCGCEASGSPTVLLLVGAMLAVFGARRARVLASA